MKLYSVELPYVDSVDLFDKVADEHWAIFLDSGVIDGKSTVSQHANFDVMAIRPHSTLVFDNGASFFEKGEVYRKLHGDPIALLQALIPTLDDDDENDFAYVPGALGYFSYDLARQYQEIPTLALNEENLPEMAMGIYYVIVLVDHESKRTFILQLGESEEAIAVRNYWHELILHTEEYADIFEERNIRERCLIKDKTSENLTRKNYEYCFNQIRKYTVEGDCYQVNMSKRFSAKVEGDAWVTYRELRKISPAPYAAYMNFPFAKVLSNSPESFIECVVESLLRAWKRSGSNLIFGALFCECTPFD